MRSQSSCSPCSDLLSLKVILKLGKCHNLLLVPVMKWTSESRQLGKCFFSCRILIEAQQEYYYYYEYLLTHFGWNQKVIVSLERKLITRLGISLHKQHSPETQLSTSPLSHLL